MLTLVQNGNTSPNQMNNLQVLHKTLEMLLKHLSEEVIVSNVPTAFVLREDKVHIVTLGERLENGALRIETTEPATAEHVKPHVIQPYVEMAKNLLFNVWSAQMKENLFQTFLLEPQEPKTVIDAGTIQLNTDESPDKADS